MQDDSIAIKERYLGLHMPHEVQALQAHLAKLADLVEAHLDMEQVFETAATAQVPPAPRQVKAAAYVKNGRQHVRIGVAKDGAFSFYYNEYDSLLCSVLRNAGYVGPEALCLFAFGVVLIAVALAFNPSQNQSSQQEQTHHKVSVVFWLRQSKAFLLAAFGSHNWQPQTWSCCCDRLYQGFPPLFGHPRHALQWWTWLTGMFGLLTYACYHLTTPCYYVASLQTPSGRSCSNAGFLPQKHHHSSHSLPDTHHLSSSFAQCIESSLHCACSNLRLLEEAGADLVFFSPIEDCLPANLGGLYLGGGYPEKYALELSGNKMLLAAVKAFAEAGGVVYAECGGLIYLSQSIQPLQEQPVSLGEPCL